MDSTRLLDFEYAVRLGQCGVDIRKMLPGARDVLMGWINGQIPTSKFIQGWPLPLPEGSEPLDSTMCLVNALAPVL